VRLLPITPVPQAAANVEGVINLRGRVLPVVNMRRCLGTPAQEVEPGREQRIVVVEVGGRRVGLHVDGAVEVLRLVPEQLQPSTGNPRDFARTEIRTGGGQAIVLLDLERLLERVEAAA